MTERSGALRGLFPRRFKKSSSPGSGNGVGEEDVEPGEETRRNGFCRRGIGWGISVRTIEDSRGTADERYAGRPIRIQGSREASEDSGHNTLCKPGQYVIGEVNAE